MGKSIVHNFTSGQLVTVPSDLGYFGPSSKERTTYEFLEYEDEGERCILKHIVTGKRSLWSIGWVKPLKNNLKKL
jgi:hypothetical protein